MKLIFWSGLFLVFMFGGWFCFGFGQVSSCISFTQVTVCDIFLTSHVSGTSFISPIKMYF